APLESKKDYLLLERVECCRDAATAEQLNDWYDTRHIHDMLSLRGVVRATRYELYRVLMVEPKSAPHFLTVYEINADAAQQVADSRRQLMKAPATNGRLSELFIEHGSALFLKINDVRAK